MLKRNAVVLATAGFLSLIIIGFGSYHYLKYGPVDFTAIYIDQLKLGPRDDRWMTWKWVKSDPAYNVLWHEIQELEERKVEKFAEAQWALYKENPNDFLALYGWTYAALKAQSQSQTLDREHPFVAISRDTLIKNFEKLPRNYEWARLRFVLTHPRSPDKNYGRLAQRLLQANPEDPLVFVIYISQLANLRNGEEKRQVFQYLEKAQKIWPKNEELLFFEGNIYSSLWQIEKKPEHAHKAIAAYRRFWKNESIDQTRRRDVRWSIERLERELRRQGRSGY